MNKGDRDLASEGMGSWPRLACPTCDVKSRMRETRVDPDKDNVCNMGAGLSASGDGIQEMKTLVQSVYLGKGLRSGTSYLPGSVQMSHTFFSNRYNSLM